MLIYLKLILLKLICNLLKLKIRFKLLFYVILLKINVIFKYIVNRFQTFTFFDNTIIIIKPIQFFYKHLHTICFVHTRFFKKEKIKYIKKSI